MVTHTSQSVGTVLQRPRRTCSSLAWLMIDDIFPSADILFFFKSYFWLTLILSKWSVLSILFIILPVFLPFSSFKSSLPTKSNCVSLSFFCLFLFFLLGEGGAQGRGGRGYVGTQLFWILFPFPFFASCQMLSNLSQLALGSSCF